MAARKKLTTTAKGLGWRHQQQVDGLKRSHRDGTACDWCGRPMYLDRAKNWDYSPASTNPTSGGLQGDHSKMSRSEAIRRGLPIPPPDRLLHGECNRQRGDGANDHLAASGGTNMQTTTELSMPWPW